MDDLMIYYGFVGFVGGLLAYILFNSWMVLRLFQVQNEVNNMRNAYNSVKGMSRNAQTDEEMEVAMLEAAQMFEEVNADGTKKYSMGEILKNIGMRHPQIAVKLGKQALKMGLKLKF